jgi:hypothetical protein
MYPHCYSNMMSLRDFALASLTFLLTISLTGVPAPAGAPPRYWAAFVLSGDWR